MVRYFFKKTPNPVLGRPREPRQMSKNVQKCPKMSKNVQKCPKMSKNVQFNVNDQLDAWYSLSSVVSLEILFIIRLASFSRGSVSTFKRMVL